jgi:hypothetical protein
MTLYSYVVARDYGFAPNPFFGVCTLATCKPKIWKAAKPGDWIVGTGSKSYALDGRIVYAMKVSELSTFDEYWTDSRFLAKRPNLRGSLKQAFGDNIYHRNPLTGKWHQEDSHHSFADGRPNKANVEHDTQTNRVLVGTEFVYWGGSGPLIPNTFRGNAGIDVCGGRGHKCAFPDKFVDSFIAWIHSLGISGYLGRPKEFGG